MAPVVFQGLVNKWVKISRNNHDALEWSKPHGNKRREDYSTRTAETSTIDSSLFQNLLRCVNGQETDVFRRSSSISRRSSTKKGLTRSDSYTDLLRRKNEEFRRDCPVYELEVNIPTIENQLQDQGVSLEQLFNPLTSDLTSSHVEEFLNMDDGEGSIERHEDVGSNCECCCVIHEKVQDYVEFTNFLQAKDSITSCVKCKEALAVATEAAKSLMMSADEDLDHDLPFLEISCDSTLKRSSATQSTSSPVPIHNESLCSDQYNVEESIALMESSRRLFEFMNLHKQRMSQLTEERNTWQYNLDSKLSQFTSMCQSIRNELATSGSETKVESNESNAMKMLQQLEKEIGQLKSQQATNISAPVRVYQNPHGTVARHMRHKFHPGSPPENLHCFTNMRTHNRILSDCSASSGALSSISDSSHLNSIQDDFMFSLDDD